MPPPRPPAPEMPPGPLRFGPDGRFELRPAEYRLLVAGEPAALGGRALDLLMALAARPGVLHTKGELMDRVWPGLVVEEGNLRVQVNTLRRVLGDEAIATVPGRGYRFAATPVAEPAVPAAGAAGGASGAGAAAVPLHDAPQDAPPVAGAALAEGPLRLFGRDSELARLRDALSPGAPCLTLVGPSGVGKSSLARVALARWPGRGVWVDLAPLTQPPQVGGAIARALGGQLSEGDAVPQLLQLLPADADLLLVLDNAEHLAEACAGWVAALQAVPRLQLLVTSQLPLGVQHERVHRIEPLQVAEGVDGPDAHEGALALLIARIHAADARFACTGAALPLLASLCRQLDGLPLALEMVAGRVPLMGLKAVHDALSERFALLGRGRRDAPARHRTLQAALDWSYGLLAPAEQRLFCALGVCAGGFTLELAVALAADEHADRWDVVDGLATLVERSLVVVSGEDPPRYRLLESMRAHALAKLQAPDAGPQAAGSAGAPTLPALPELPVLRRRHAAAVRAQVATRDAASDWLPDMENVREAMHWALQHDTALAAELGQRAGFVMAFSVWRQELTDWMVALQPQMLAPAGLALPRPVQAGYWLRLSSLLLMRGQPAQATARRAVDLLRAEGEPEQLLAALSVFIRSFTEASPELAAACALLQAGLDGDASAITRLRAWGALAVAARLRNDLEAVLQCHEQERLAALELGRTAHAQAAESNVCLYLARCDRGVEAVVRGRALLRGIDAADGDANGNLPWVLNALVEALVVQRALDEALALAPRSLAAGRRFGTTVAWEGLLSLAAARQRPAVAARLVGYVDRLWTQGGQRVDEEAQRAIDRARALASQHLDAAARAALEAEGRGLDESAAAALLGAEGHGAPAGPG